MHWEVRLYLEINREATKSGYCDCILCKTRWLLTDLTWHWTFFLKLYVSGVRWIFPAEIISAPFHSLNKTQPAFVYVILTHGMMSLKFCNICKKKIFIMSFIKSHYSLSTTGCSQVSVQATGQLHWKEAKSIFLHSWLSFRSVLQFSFMHLMKWGHSSKQQRLSGRNMRGDSSHRVFDVREPAAAFNVRPTEDSAAEERHINLGFDTSWWYYSCCGFG